MGEGQAVPPTVWWDGGERAVVIIDQTKLPGKLEYLRLRTAREIREAIYLLKVRGAPAIGVTAALGIAMLAQDFSGEDYTEFCRQFGDAKAYLLAARPTAVNLSWALERMEGVVRSWTPPGWQAGDDGTDLAGLKERLLREAQNIWEEDIRVCRSIGEYGLGLVRPGAGILTHCNAGRLATVRYGTATAPIYLGQERGYGFHVYADETRPLLQGARLTAYELSSAGVDVTLLCDNMCAYAMKKGWIDAVFVGCDRVAANGDAANKIGTLVVATVAARYGVPFYVCAPTSTIDLNTHTGEQIPIEIRPDGEVTRMWYREPMAPENIRVLNPAFDVTDAELISGIVTEFGVALPPYEASLRELLAARAARAGAPGEEAKP